jgi:Protein of unknown function (DUF2877)
MSTAIAHSIGGPLIRELAHPRDGEVLGGGGGAVYVMLLGTAVAVTARGVPRMPNGIGVGASPGDLKQIVPGQTVKYRPGALNLGFIEIVWDSESPPIWPANIVPIPPEAAGSIRARLSRLMPPAPPSPELEAIARAVASRRIADAAVLGERLAGAGMGLTPRGDDLLAGAALAVRALGPSAGWSATELAGWLRALLPDALSTRTNLLSAEMLRLAVDGFGIEPVLRLFDPIDPDPRAAMLGLLRVGRSTGSSYANVIGLVASTLHLNPRRTGGEDVGRPRADDEKHEAA